jgi:hypothetical protein
VQYTRWLGLEHLAPHIAEENEEETATTTLVVDEVTKKITTTVVRDTSVVTTSAEKLKRNATSSPLYEVSMEALEKERQNMSTILSSYPIAYIQNTSTHSSSANNAHLYSECRKLIKDLERCRNNAERIQLNYFLTPVNDNILSDYSVYVRNPIDIR